MTYRQAIATALIALTLTACQPEHTYDQVCPAPSEDSPVTCDLDPDARYTYDGGVWMQVPAETTFANGNRPPTGADVMAFDPDR